MSERACQAVGIDLGTTYSSLAYMDAQLTPRIVSDLSGQAVMPSVIFFDQNEIIVGEMALSQAKLDSDRAVQFIKAQMGEPWRKEFNGQLHTPESLSALILGQLIHESEPQIGAIRSAVITVPAYFTEKRRRATQQAGEIAGLNVIGTLNEPMAAMLAYGLHRGGKPETVVVYDLGGGTFDVTVVRIDKNELEELATNGNRQLGGRDWDQSIIDFACDDFRKKHQQDPRSDAQVMQDLQIQCEQAKRKLSRLQQAPIRFMVHGIDHTVTLTREGFDALTAPLIQATKLTTEIALEDAGLNWSAVTRVVLVGGSTHMPQVQTMLKELCGRVPDRGVNPVLAVALGAAIYAHMIETGKGMKIVQPAKPEAVVPPPRATPIPVKPPDHNTPVRIDDTAGAPPIVPAVRFVTAHGVGLKVIGPNGKWYNQVLIPKNTRVPHRVTQRFKTTGGKAGAVTAISIVVTQGDTDQTELAEILGVCRIGGIPTNSAPGQPVDVTMEFDDQGRLQMRAVYVPTSQAMNMSLDVLGGLKREEVEVYRDYLQRSGFIRPFDAVKAMQEMEIIDDDEEDDLEMIEPV